MIFLPYERFIIKTHFDADTVLSKIDSIAERPTGWFSLFYTNEGKPYLGKIKDNHFELNRYIHFRNSFLPVIKGRVNWDVNGSIVMVTMRLSICVIIFLSVWFGVLIYSLFSGLIEIIKSGDFANVSFDGLAIFLGFLLFGYLLTMAGFKYESLKSKAFLADLLDAQQVIELGLLETELNT